MQTVKQGSTSYVYAYMCDATDGYSPETGITSPSLFLSKNGAAEAAPNDGTWAEIDSTNCPGLYTVRLNATDTDTVGPCALDVYKSGTSRHFVTVFYVAAALLDEIKTDTAAILTDTETDGVVIPAATLTALVDAIWDELTSGHADAGSTGKALTSATAAADPWSVDLPGSYIAGQAGYEIARALNGSGAGVGSITVENEDDVPMEGVRVDIYTSATLMSPDYFWTGGFTNSSGVYAFYAPIGTYYARRHKRGYAFAADPITITIT